MGLFDWLLGKSTSNNDRDFEWYRDEFISLMNLEKSAIEESDPNIGQQFLDIRALAVSFAKFKETHPEISEDEMKEIVVAASKVGYRKS